MASNNQQYRRASNEDHQMDDDPPTTIDGRYDLLGLPLETPTNPQERKESAEHRTCNPSDSSVRFMADPHQTRSLMRVRTSLVNDISLLRQRRAGIKSHGLSQFEIMSEDKIAHNKLDQLHWSIPSSASSTFMMAFSPDGLRVASTHGDHRIFICDLNTGEQLDTLEGHSKTPCCFAWHPSNKNFLASGCLSGEVRIWDLRSRSCVSWTSENSTIITSLSFHPTDRIIAMATANSIHFWDWSETVPYAVSTTSFEKERVKYVEFDSTGSKLITGITNWSTITGASSDSLQNRIIDTYLHDNNNENVAVQTQNNNMTQNSEISSQQNMPRITTDNLENDNPSSNDNYGSERQATVPNSSDETPDLNLAQTVTTTLSRIACLYRNLEALEYSIRHTSFSPINQSEATSVNTSQSNTIPVNSNIIDSTGLDNRSTNDQQTQTPNNDIVTEPPITNSQNSDPNVQESSTNHNTTLRSPMAYEPLVVLFDELLEGIQLRQIVARNRTLDLTAILARNPIDVSNQLDYVVQLDFINQVNQNFIRISKLMSSIRLYRQIIQQILASNTNPGHYQPNQFLTAQSTMGSPNRIGNPLHPIVLRCRGVQGIDGLNVDNTSRSIDPIMAIQFRNCARNVPLGSVCKADLLAARTMCLMRSQQYIENFLSQTGTRSQQDLDPNDILANLILRQLPDTPDSGITSNTNSQNQTPRIIEPIYFLLNHLHRVLSMINQTPLTTSNVHTQISSLRSILYKLLDKFASMIHTKEDAEQLVKLVHLISESLTSRPIGNPLGHTFNELRLDVIHTFCMTDLTLHLFRQIQFLQMQRISAIARLTNANSQNRGSRASTLISNPGRQCESIIDQMRNNEGTQLNEPSTSANDRSQLPSTSTSSILNFSSSDNQRSESFDRRDIGDKSDKKRDIASISMRCDDSVESKKPRLDPQTDTHMIETKQPEQNPRNLVIDNLVISAANALSGTRNPSTAESSTNSNPREGDIISYTQQNSHAILDREPMTSESNQAIQNHSGPITHDLSLDRALPDNPSPLAAALEQSLQRVYLSTAHSNIHVLMRIIHRVHSGPLSSGPLIENSLDRSSNPPITYRRRTLSHDNSSLNDITSQQDQPRMVDVNLETQPVPRVRYVTTTPTNNAPGPTSHSDAWPRHQFHILIPNHARSQNVLWMALPTASPNFRVQCWKFGSDRIPKISNSGQNLITNRCRIDTNASIDISRDGSVIACLVPQDEFNGPFATRYDLKVISLRDHDFGVCHFSIPQSHQAISVSLSPKARYAVVGMSSSRSLFSNNMNPEDPDGITIAKIFKLVDDKGKVDHVRDIKIKRQGALNLNAIRWLPRGIVYNIGQHPLYQHRYQARRFNYG